MRSHAAGSTLVLSLVLSLAVSLIAGACAGGDGKHLASPVSGEASPEERPGLGTSWGESRTSPASETAFARASGRPWATFAVYYDDAEGVAAQILWRGGPQPAPIRVGGSGVTVWLADEWGRALPGVWAAGRPHVVGEAGQRYALVVQNLSGTRQEVVATVDGLDVVDGRPGSPEKRGYVVAPGQTLTIDGFRESWQEVAAFRFGRVADSYAARTGGDRDVGVVGVAFFDEAAGARFGDDEVWRRETADPFPGWR